MPPSLGVLHELCHGLNLKQQHVIPSPSLPARMQCPLEKVQESSQFGRQGAGGVRTELG